MDVLVFVAGGGSWLVVVVTIVIVVVAAVLGAIVVALCFFVAVVLCLFVRSVVGGGSVGSPCACACECVGHRRPCSFVLWASRFLDPDDVIGGVVHGNLLILAMMNAGGC